MTVVYAGQVRTTLKECVRRTDDVEYHRLVPPTGGTVTITAMQFREEGGGSSSNVTLDVYGVDAAAVVNQITLGSADRATHTAGQGSMVLVRMSNSNWDGSSSRPEYETDWAADGSLSVEIAGNGFTVYNYSRPGDGLPTYPVNDCTYRVAAYQVKDSSSWMFRLWWGMDPADSDPSTNSYKLEGGPEAEDGSSTGNTAVVEYSGGSKTQLAESSTALTERTLYDVAVTFRENNGETVSDLVIYQWDDENSESHSDGYGRRQPQSGRYRVRL